MPRNFRDGTLGVVISGGIRWRLNESCFIRPRYREDASGLLS
jgi:hypothetical protein